VDELRRAAADPSRLLVVETSPAFPRTRGLPPEHPHSLDLSEVDIWIESDARPRVLDDAPAGDIERAIAAHVARFVPAGATLQTGIGGIPSAVVELLAQDTGGDYGIHTEMFTTGLMELCEAGQVTNRKGVYDGLSVATFAMGSRELYDWLDEREDVVFLPVDVVNEPAVIGRNRSPISLNGALCVDLFGQVTADDRGTGQFSGIGGHEDFLAGTGYSATGRSLVCLPSTAGGPQTRQSRIVSRLPEEALVTSPRHQVDVIVTEFGAAELAGRTVEERARALAGIAHPDWRDELLAAADRLRRRGVIEGR
jgi:acyl-CoA hydrolase